MKRAFVFAVLAGLSAGPLTVARADDLPPGQITPPESSQPNVVAPEAPRGELGGLASGAPSFAANVQQLRGRLDGQAMGATGPAAAPAAAPAAGAASVATGTAVVAQKQTITPAQSYRMVRMVNHYCLRAHWISKGAHPAFLPPVSFGKPLVILPPGGPSIGDLELLGVGIVSEMAGEHGPVYRVTFRNSSRFPVHHFRVSLIAVQGELTHASPVMTMTIDALAAGAMGHVDVQLPCSVMTMGPQDQPVPFETLVASIDSFDELIEDSELNNVATFTRGEIAMIQVTETTAAAAPAAGASVPGTVAAPAAGAVAPGAAAPGGPTAGGPIAGGPAAGGEAPAGPQAAPGGAPGQGAGAAPPPQPGPAAGPPQQAPQDSSLLDNLDIDASSTSQLFAR